MVKTISILANTTTPVTMGGGLHCRVTNRGLATLYATANANLTAEADGVYAVPTGETCVVRNLSKLFGGTNVLRLRCASACKVEVEDIDSLNFSLPLGDRSAEGQWQTALAIGDCCYAGQDLSEKFAAEIAASPYAGDQWAWVKARITAGNYAGIHIGDYLPFAVDGTTYHAQVAGIDTYTGGGDVALGHHIDFISKELWGTVHAINQYNYNNGYVPVATCSGNGSQTVFVLSHTMASVYSVTVSGTAMAATDYAYDASTGTITFVNPPAAGTGNIVVTGVGTKYPWIASDLFLWLNSLSGQIVGGTGYNPQPVTVNYTSGGVYALLPTSLKAVIVEKRAIAAQRFLQTDLLTSNSGAGWANIGKLWLPSETEVCGAPIWGGAGYANWGDVQYPLFYGNTNRVKLRAGERARWWLLLPPDGYSADWCYVNLNGTCAHMSASTSNTGVPLCFRIA